MSATVASMLQETYKRFNELDLQYWQDREAKFFVDPETTRRRAECAEVLKFWTQQYADATGQDFVWPREALDHAKANYINERG